MNFYEYLPHEYSYALYLADIYDLYPFDSMIHNMVSERYPRDEDEDCASAYDSESCEEDESVNVEILNTSTQNLESSTSQNSILFGSFATPIIPVSIPSMTPDFDGCSIKIGEIRCFLGDSCCDVDLLITVSEEDKHSKDFETELVLSAVSQKLQNQSGVQAFSSPIKVERQHDGNVRFLQDHDPNGKKGELLSDLLLPSSKSITFFFPHRGLCITVFDPGGTMAMIYSSVTLSFLSKFISIYFIVCVFVFDPGGNHHDFCSPLILQYKGILDRADTILLLFELIHGEIVVLGIKIKIQLRLIEHGKKMTENYSFENPEALFSFESIFCGALLNNYGAIGCQTMLLCCFKFWINAS
ncbi:unnamed protein product [Trifolium pratense]|uniref:Uncharacterized protein n=1 Tax=Trifolium pratense TaxID=57577 RepID=A0ACB0J5N3_TRIPR|nr:unnamed protein product [Trifolium pratense]